MADWKKIVSHLQNIINELDCTHTLEYENLQLDLMAVKARLISGEYAITDFIQRNKFDIPRRTAEFFHYINDWHLQANSWGAIIKAFRLKKSDTVVNLCCGWSPKVELGLHYAGFKGRAIPLDRNMASIQRLMNFMELFRPDFVITPVSCDVFTTRKIQTNLLIANHAIDDLILDYYSAELGCHIEDMYKSEKLYQESVRSVMKLMDSKKITALLSTTIDKMLVPGGHLLMAEYLSLADHDLGLQGWHKKCLQIMKKLKANLEHKGYKDHSGLVANNLKKEPRKYFDARNILVLQKTKK